MATMKTLAAALSECVTKGREFLDAVEEAAGLLDAAAAPMRNSEFGIRNETEEENVVPLTATLEQVRGVLAEKARNGFRAEVKALLTAHGAKQLSDITNPAELGTLKKEAEKLGG